MGLFKLFTAGVLSLLTMGCADLLPKGETITQGPWKDYADALHTFQQIEPYRTTVADLRRLHLDPKTNPNITILNYSDILRRFIPTPAIDAEDLDGGVRDCIEAKSQCIGYEINQENVSRHRSGSFWADFFNFKRRVEVAGWRFNGVILLRNGLVVYELTGGEPIIRETEEQRNPLGPLQGIGSSASYLQF